MFPAPHHAEGRVAWSALARTHPQCHIMTVDLRPGARILALDLHPQRYGYAVLEVPANLLDWGVRRRYRKRRPSSNSIYTCLQSLLGIWRPSFVLIKKPSKHRTARTEKRLAGLIDTVRRSRIPTRSLTDHDVRSVFGSGSSITKYAMASMLVRQFPFLASTLPPPRKIFRSEDYRMSMFAAIALALAASSQRHTTDRYVRTVQ